MEVMTTDYAKDYNEAQASGHHVNCDGWMTEHRVSVIETRFRDGYKDYHALCEACGELHVGAFGQKENAEAFYSHQNEVSCDGRCKDWK